MKRPSVERDLEARSHRALGGSDADMKRGRKGSRQRAPRNPLLDGHTRRFDLAPLPRKRAGLDGQREDEDAENESGGESNPKSPTGDRGPGRQHEEDGQQRDGKARERGDREVLEYERREQDPSEKPRFPIAPGQNDGEARDYEKWSGDSAAVLEHSPDG
jgi:hypothetical protein